MKSVFREEKVGGCPVPVFKSEAECTSSAKKQRVDPVVKAWLDIVLVPAMVRLYLATDSAEADNGLVPVTERVQ